jgi:thiol-disulfide isomerase/thioredoxin
MKKLLFIFPFLLISWSAFSQTNSSNENIPAYMSNPNVPDFSLYKAPDSTAFTNEDIHKRKPTLIMIFSPECGHCQHITSLLIQNIEHFKNAQILMTTWLPYSEMMKFYKDYKIADYPQITMAWDKKVFFLTYYRVQSYPDLVVYNKKGKFIKSFSGDVKMKDVWEAMGE